MAYPTDLTTFTDVTCNDNRLIKDVVNDVFDKIEAIEGKVGVDSSAVVTSVDYKLTNPASSNPGHTHTLSTGATDVTASALELNILDGATLSTAELNVLDGVTASTAELNILDGVTADATEINKLDGALVSTTELNKLVGLLADSSELNILDGATLSTAELNILDGVTADASEINKLDGLLASTAQLNILNGATLSTAELNILDGVTADATEINKLDGLLASTAQLNILNGATLSTAELNLLDGVTATTAELNILDGVTATFSEINVLDGITSSTAELNILDGVTSTATELNFNDGSVAGTSVASKTLVLGASKNTDLLTIDNAIKYNMPPGHMVNGKFDISVASNNLTLSLKTLAGSDPSSSSPVYVRIGDSVYTISSALSLTTNAGTNWFGSGSAETASQEIDYFVYLAWHSASSAVRIGFSRIPYAIFYADFSTTSTDDYHGRFNTAPGISDPVQVFGRFNAVLSATASFNWSLSSGTTIIINRPIYRTRRLVWVPTFTGFSANPTGDFFYYIDNQKCELTSDPTANGTSNATNFLMTAPITAASIPAFSGTIIWDARDNGALLTVAARAFIQGGTKSISLFTNVASGTWTSSGGKRARYLFNYYIASTGV